MHEWPYKAIARIHNIILVIAQKILIRNFPVQPVPSGRGCGQHTTCMSTK